MDQNPKIIPPTAGEYTEEELFLLQYQKVPFKDAEKFKAAYEKLMNQYEKEIDQLEKEQRRSNDSTLHQLKIERLRINYIGRSFALAGYLYEYEWVWKKKMERRKKKEAKENERVKRSKTT
jgi:hypothetical protein